MRCPRCACQDDKVVDSRATKEGAGVRRRRECLNCGHRFTTYEEIIQAELKVLKRDNTHEDFDREKLRRGIEKACWKRNIRPEQIDTLLSKIVMEIETEYDREISSVEIGTKAMAALRQLDKVAYVRFASVYRDFKDIEEFISEIRTIGAKKR
ncbi:MAG TPA: transcriptional regulator NrdR [Lentisphaeria bacterium]|nr:transcriptional regulator NrdR [Lentisphaeria bacterium]HCG51741.1 transcriptional regulator NrdR [Lentisphaeria bacterium]